MPTNISPKKKQINNKKAYLNTLSDRLNYALKSLGIKQSELAKRISVSQPTIQYLCKSGANKSRYLYEISEALGINNSWLSSGEGQMKLEDTPEFQALKEQRRIPIIGSSEIKELAKNKPNDITNIQNSDKYVITNTEVGKNSFGLALFDKSMSPLFSKGTIVIINPDKIPQQNDLVVAYLKESQDIIFRQYQEEENLVLLQPLNFLIYKPVTLKKSDKIIGVMVEARWDI